MKGVKGKYRIVIVAIVLLLSGCADKEFTTSSTTFYLAYDSEEVIYNQSKIATITSANSFEVNGVLLTNEKMRSEYYYRIKKRIEIADTLPGEHRIRVTADVSGNPVQMEPITYNFEAGRIYSIVLEPSADVEIDYISIKKISFADVGLQNLIWLRFLASRMKARQFVVEK